MSGVPSVGAQSPSSIPYQLMLKWFESGEKSVRLSVRGSKGGGRGEGAGWDLRKARAELVRRLMKVEG